MEEVEKIDEVFNSLEDLSTQILKMRSELNTKLSRIDQKICDIRHYIELYPLSASDGYQKAKLLQEVLRERRQIKNAMERINVIVTQQVVTVGQGKSRKSLSENSPVKYRPRIMPELFAGKSLLVSRSDDK